MSTRKILLIGIIFILLLGGLGAGLYLIREQQLLPKKAAVSTGTATIRLNPETKTVSVGTTFPVQISFTTGGLPISAVTAELNYPYTGVEPPIAVTSIQLNSSLLGTGEWSVPIKTFTTQGGNARVRIAAINTSLSGFSSLTETALATIVFQANAAGSVTVTFNPTENKMTMKADGKDNLLIPTSTGNYSTQETQPSATPTPPVGEPSATPTPTTGGPSCTSLDIPGGTSRSVNEQIRFTCTGSPSSLVTQCRFQFGDGSAETLDDDCNIFHTYASTGSFDVSCNVRDVGGSWKSATACANRMTVAAAASTPTPAGTSTTTGGTPLPESGSTLPTILLGIAGAALVALGARFALPLR